MVVIDLVVEDLLAGVDDPPAAREHAVDPVAGMVPEREPDLSALAVFLGEGMLVECPVFLGRPQQETDLIGIEHRIDEQIATCCISGKLFGRKWTATHGRGSVINERE